MAFSPQQWVNILAEKEDPVYSKPFLKLDGKAVLNLCYDRPLKRKWLRLWLRQHPRKFPIPGLPSSGQEILESHEYNAYAVINWWQVVWEGEVWSLPDHASNALSARDPLAAHVLESALTADRDKAEAWASVVQHSGRSLLSIYNPDDLMDSFKNLLVQTQAGREWEFLLLGRAAIAATGSLSIFEVQHQEFVFRQMMMALLNYFIDQNYVESVEVMVSSGVLAGAACRNCLMQKQGPSKPWIDGIVKGLLPPLDSVYYSSDDEMADDSFESPGLQEAWMHQVLI
jgi:hypothetical protein